MNKIEYGFTAIPNTFIYLFDNTTYKLISFYILKYNYFNSINRLNNDGYFYLSTDDISRALGINKKDVCYVNEALYNAELIDIECEGFEAGRRHTNKYKLNQSKIEELASIPLKDIIEGDINIYIKKCKRGIKCSYVANSSQNENNTKVQNATNNGTKSDLNDVVLDAKSNPTLDNIYNIKDINVYNVIENETAINNNTDESIEDYYKRMFEEEKEIIDGMNETFDCSNGEEYNNNNINDSNRIIIDGLALQEWITKIFNAIDEYNDKFFKCSTVEDAKYYNNKLGRLFEIVHQYNDVFSDAQWDVVRTKADRYIKIDEQKQKYLKLKCKNSKHYHQSSTEIKTINDNPESINYFAPSPLTAEEMHEQMMADLMNRF